MEGYFKTCDLIKYTLFVVSVLTVDACSEENILASTVIPSSRVYSTKMSRQGYVEKQDALRPPQVQVIIRSRSSSDFKVRHLVALKVCTRRVGPTIKIMNPENNKSSKRA